MLNMEAPKLGFELHEISQPRWITAVTRVHGLR